MRTLYLCGAGNSEGVRLAQRLNREQGRWDTIELLDDDPDKLGTSRIGVPVTGPLAMLEACDPATTEAVNLVARTTRGRRAVGTRIRASGVPYARMVAADVDLEGALLAPDVMVYQHATIGPEVVIEEGAVVFMGAVVGHESHVGAGCVIASNAVLNARVRLGEGVYVGSCATIIPEVTVGDWAMIGAGSLVVQDVPPGATVVGVPATIVQHDVVQRAAPGGASADCRSMEAIIVAVWREVLGHDQITREQNFFDLGGCSLHALRMRERLRQETGRELAITDLFRFPSVRTLAEHMSRGSSEGEGSPLARSWARRAALRRGLHVGGVP